MLKYVLLMITLAGCLNNTSPSIPPVTNDVKDTLVVQTADTTVKQNKVRLFDNKKPFTLTVFGNRIDRNTSDEDTVKCNNWKLTQGEVARIMANSEPIDGTVWDFEFEVLTCTVVGEIIQDKIVYPFEVNAGAYAWVHCGDTSVIYGDYKKRDRKLFLSFPQAQ